MRTLAVALLFLAVAAFPGRAETLILDPSTGSLRVLLYKDGPLRALGHDHVLRAPIFEGRVEFSGSAAELTLSINARALQIDENSARAAEGLPSISAKDQAKINDGMRGSKGLDVERHPSITFRSSMIELVAGEKDLWLLTGQFTLHGSSQTIDFPVTVADGLGGGRWFTGYVRLRPSEYGVKPFSVFGGAVRLKDEALVRFTLLGRPAQGL